MMAVFGGGNIVTEVRDFLNFLCSGVSLFVSGVAKEWEFAKATVHECFVRFVCFIHLFT